MWLAVKTFFGGIFGKFATAGLILLGLGATIIAVLSGAKKAGKDEQRVAEQEAQAEQAEKVSERIAGGIQGGTRARESIDRDGLRAPDRYERKDS